MAGFVFFGCPFHSLNEEEFPYELRNCLKNPDVPLRIVLSAVHPVAIPYRRSEVRPGTLAVYS